MHVIKLDYDTHIWRDFLQKNESLIFHTPEWKQLIDKSFRNVKTAYFAVLEGEEIKLVFPFLHIEHPVLGEKLISCGFIEYGGPAGEENRGAVEMVLDEVAKSYGGSAEYLEVREGLEKFGPVLGRTKLIRRAEYKRFITRLGAAEELWKKLNKHRRKAVRKAEKDGIVVREIQNADLGAVYSLYIQSMKEFGSPPFSRKFFENFYSILVSKGLARGFGAYCKGKLAALLIGYTYGGRIHIIINVSDPKYLECRPNDAVHWAFMKWGCDSGYKVFDWGRVREESGQFKFKSLWASEMQNLNHYYLLWNSREIPRVDPTNPRYKVFIWLWRHTPLFLSKRIGPWLREGLGI